MKDLFSYVHYHLQCLNIYLVDAKEWINNSFFFLIIFFLIVNIILLKFLYYQYYIHTNENKNTF